MKKNKKRLLSFGLAFLLASTATPVHSEENQPLEIVEEMPNNFEFDSTNINLSIESLQSLITYSQSLIESAERNAIESETLDNLTSKAIQGEKNTTNEVEKLFNELVAECNKVNQQLYDLFSTRVIKNENYLKELEKNNNYSEKDLVDIYMFIDMEKQALISFNMNDASLYDAFVCSLIENLYSNLVNEESKNLVDNQLTDSLNRMKEISYTDGIYFTRVTEYCTPYIEEVTNVIANWQNYSYQRLFEYKEDIFNEQYAEARKMTYEEFLYYLNWYIEDIGDQSKNEKVIDEYSKFIKYVNQYWFDINDIEHAKSLEIPNTYCIILNDINQIYTSIMPMLGKNAQEVPSYEEYLEAQKELILTK